MSSKNVLIVLAVIVLISVGGYLTYRAMNGTPDKALTEGSPNVPEQNEARRYSGEAINIEADRAAQIKDDPTLDDTLKGELDQRISGIRDDLIKNNSDLMTGNPNKIVPSVYDEMVEGQYLRLVYLFNLMDSSSTREPSKELIEAIEETKRKITTEGTLAAFKLKDPSNFKYDQGHVYHAAYTQWLLLYAFLLDANERNLMFDNDEALAAKLLSEIETSSQKWTEVKPEASLYNKGLNGKSRDFIDVSVATLGMYVVLNCELGSDEAKGNVGTLFIGKEGSKFMSKIGGNLCRYFEDVHSAGIDPTLMGAKYRRNSAKEGSTLVGGKILYFLLKSRLAYYEQVYEGKTVDQIEYDENFDKALKMSVALFKDDEDGKPYYKSVINDTYTACYAIRALVTLARFSNLKEEHRANVPLLLKRAAILIDHSTNATLPERYSGYYKRLIVSSASHDLKVAAIENQKVNTQESGQ